MAIQPFEDVNNNTRLNAIRARVQKQITLELLYRVGSTNCGGYDITVPPATVTAMKQEFAQLRNEIHTLEDNIVEA